MSTENLNYYFSVYISEHFKMSPLIVFVYIHFFYFNHTTKILHIFTGESGDCVIYQIYLTIQHYVIVKSLL